MHIAIEGWRFLPHSYALIAQSLSLEIDCRNENIVYFDDYPKYRECWSWQSGLFGKLAEDQLDRFPSSASAAILDGRVRIAFPYDFETNADENVLLFATSEFGIVPDSYLTTGSCLSRIPENIKIVTCSQWSAEGFVNSGVPPARLHQIPLGFDPDIFWPRIDSPRQLAAGGVDDFVFLNVGAITPNKNVLQLVKAFAEVASQRTNVRLHLKGLDSLYGSRAQLQEVAKSLTQRELSIVQPRLTYTGGSLSLSQMADIYRSSDAYVSPYLAEAFNLPVLEALACGLPVICSAGGPTDDFATTASTLHITTARRRRDDGGYELAPDVDHLIAAMKQAIAEDNLWREAHAEAHDSVEKFTWAHIANQYLSCFAS